MEDSNEKNLAIAGRVLDAESVYSMNFYDGREAPGSVLAVHRDSRILISAPHSLNHFRDGSVKYADRRTGGMAMVLAELIRSSVVIPTGAIGKWDTWATRDDEFKTELDHATLTDNSFTIDLHGMSDRHDIDICIGMGPEPSGRVHSFAQSLMSELDEYRISINVPFSAAPDFTVTSYLQHRRRDAIQLEITARLRDPEVLPQEHGALLHRLAQFIERWDRE